MSDLSDNLLRQILDQQQDMQKELGAHGAKIDTLRIELTGPSGKNGRLGKIEADVKELRDAENQRKGFRYLIDLLIAAAASIGYHRIFK